MYGKTFLFIVLLSLPLLLSLHLGGSVHMEEKGRPYSTEKGSQETIPLRVMTYNIRYGRGIDGVVHLGGIAEVIKRERVDIVGLQEVERFSPRSHFVDQTTLLAEELGFYAIYGPALFIGPYRYGNAILSKSPILSWEVVPISSSREPRNFIKAIISIEGVPITFICTHLGLSHEERMKHVEKIIETIRGKENPVIVVGDFNAIPNSPEIHRVQEYLTDAHREVGVGSGFTFPSDDPKYRIDYIFTSPHSLIQSLESIESLASDHRPVVAEMYLFVD